MTNGSGERAILERFLAPALAEEGMHEMITNADTRAVVEETLAPDAEITFEVPYMEGGAPWGT